MDMLARIKADIAHYARQSNEACVCTLLLADAAELTADAADPDVAGHARAAAEGALLQLIRRLELQQSKDG